MKAISPSAGGIGARRWNADTFAAYGRTRTGVVPSVTGNLPTQITHYYSRSDRPFQNLSDLQGAELDATLLALKERAERDPRYARVFGKCYMEFRQRTEAKLRTLFVERGGAPVRQAPHNFTLGECAWFSGLYPDTATVKLDWRLLPRDVASFTYPDSFVAMRLGPEFGLPPEPRRPYHERVFFLDELSGILADYGLPDGRAEQDYSGYHKRDFEKYIEVQIWSDEPVQNYLTA